MRKILLLLGTFLLILSLTPVMADEQEKQSEKKKERIQHEEGHQGEDIPLLGAKDEQNLDDLQQEATRVLLSAATWLDSFFDDPRYTSEQNTTRAKVKLEFGYSENDDFEFKPRVDIRLNVPKLENRLQVLITASDDSDFDTDSNSTSGSAVEDKDQLSLSLQYFAAVGEKYNVSTSFGGSYDYLYAGLRYRYFHDFGPWQLRFTNRTRYYTDDGWENKTEGDIERHFSDKLFFRTIANVTWKEERDSVAQSLKLRLYQVINKQHALLYEVGSYFETEPNYHMSDFQLKLRYRQRFYRDWLVFELAPQVTFPADHGRDANPGIVVKFEFDFGYLANQDEYDTVFRF